MWRSYFHSSGEIFSVRWHYYYMKTPLSKCSLNPFPVDLSNCYWQECRLYYMARALLCQYFYCEITFLSGVAHPFCQNEHRNHDFMLLVFSFAWNILKYQ